jgi:hypothetical protein
VVSVLARWTTYDSNQLLPSHQALDVAVLDSGDLFQVGASLELRERPGVVFPVD